MIAKATKKPLSKGVDQMRIPTETKSYDHTKLGGFQETSDLKTGQLATQLVAAAEFFCRKEGGVKGRSRHGLWRKSRDTHKVHLDF